MNDCNDRHMCERASASERAASTRPAWPGNAMNDDPLDRAVRSALRDIVAAAPDRHDVPVRAEQFRAEGGRRRPLLAAAVGLIAAAGIVAVVAVSTRSTITTETAPATTGAPPSTAPATTSTTAITTTTISATTTVAPTPGPLRRVEFQRGTNNTSVTDEIGRERATASSSKPRPSSG